MVRRLIGVLACLVMLAGCGGGGFGEAPERGVLDALTPHYETDVRMRLGEEELQAHIAHPTPEQCEVTLLAPESVAGMNYRFRQDNVDLSYKELSFTLDPDGMPPTAPAKLLVDALSLLLRIDDPAQLTANGEVWELRAILPQAGECVLEVDAETLAPRKLFLPALEWEIALENFVVFA